MLIYVIYCGRYPTRQVVLAGAVALEVNHVTGFPEVFFPLRSLFFPLVKPTFRESTGKGAVILFNGFLLFLLGPLLQIQGQHCHFVLEVPCRRGSGRIASC